MEQLTSIYTPEARNCGRKVKLGTIDQIAPRVYITIYLFFRMQPGYSKEHVYAQMKEAIHRTITEIPQLTTTIKACNNGRDEVELSYDSSRGCIYTYKDYESTPERRALWPHGDFDTLDAAHFPYSTCEKHLLLCPVEEYDYPPSFAAQSNFIPGGHVLTTMLSHVVGDGVTNYLLYQTLTKHMAAVADGQRVSPGTTSINFCERSEVVEPDSDGLKMDEFPNWRRAKSEEVHVLPVKPQEEVETIPKAQYSVFFITEQKQKQLAAFISEKADSKISTIEAIGAFLWQQVTAARGIDTKRYPEAKLSVTVDTRRCMEDPVLPTNYWGNFSEPNAVARIPTSLLMDRPPPGKDERQHVGEILAEACDRVRNAIIAVDSTAVRRLVGLINQMPKSSTLTWNVDRWPGPDMLMVCVNFHDYYNLNYGRFTGQPACGRFMIGDPDGKPDGRCLVCPMRPSDGKGLEIALQYDSETTARLQSSAIFNEFFVRRN